LVRELATTLTGAGAQLYEDPFDILAILESVGVLIEVKTLDGTDRDERERVRDALGQILYYESFLAAAVAGEAPIVKIAFFEARISNDHQLWLNDHGVATLWKFEGRIVGDDLARMELSGFLGPLR
jgi:hypothetical protein